MKARFDRVMACSLGLLVMLTAGHPPPAFAQDTAPPPAASQDNPAPIYSPEQLDQLVAPIALYPDPLLAQTLMAATYPLEVVEASRWVQDPANAQLRGDQLDAALQPMDWDPSVKSLVPFPQTLKMMDSKLDWTQALGNAFLAQQGDVMDAVQRLRSQAQAAGNLQSTAQQTVSTEGQTIAIAPANPQVVYVPYYNPTVVYGAWAYPDYPPVYFPPPVGYGYVVGPTISFGIGFGIVGALWGWDSCDWHRHDIHIDDVHYNQINNYIDVHHDRPRYTQTTWQHDPAHRRGVPYSSPAVRQRYQQYQRVSAPSADARRDFRGFDNRGTAPHGPAPAGAPRPEPQRQAALPPNQRPNEAQHPNNAPRPNEAQHPNVAQYQGNAPRQNEARPPAGRPAAQANARTPAPPQQHAPPPQQRAPAPPPVQHAAAPRPMAPAYSSFGRGTVVRAQAQRGQQSRATMASVQHSAPPRPAPQQHSAPPPHNPPPSSNQKGKK